jgi:hypothetical protein
MTQLTVKNLDHLGIIAAIIDELGIVDYINQQLGEKDTTKISAGLVVKAMILNGLGFINSPLYSAFHVREVSTSFANKGFKLLAHTSF